MSQAVAAEVATWALAAWGEGARVIGVQGTQGSGKSTLCGQVAERLRGEGLVVVVLSIDDGYLTRHARQTLAQTLHPLFETRGVPGTHDVGALEQVLASLRAGEPTLVPRFAKGIDDRLPPVQAPAGTQLVLFEGWCVGLPPVPAGSLEVPCNPLEREKDPDGAWRAAVAAALAGPYARLWNTLDRLLVLQAPGWEVVRGWRRQQEHDLPPDQRMSDAALDRFLAHYERWTRWALTAMPDHADALLRLDAKRVPTGPLEVRVPQEPSTR